MRWLSLVVIAGLLAAAIGASSSCAGTGADGPDLLSPPDGGGGDQPDDLAIVGCFMGQPLNESQLLNACTDAERIERPHRVPKTVWDGKSPLPPAL